MTAPTAVFLKPSAAEPVAGAGAAVPIDPERTVARLSVDVLALEPSHTLTLTIETALSAGGSWSALDTVVMTSVGIQELVLSGCQRLLRVLWDLSGATVTFGVEGVVEQCYASPADMTALSLPAAALSKLTAPERALACIAATDEAASYLGAFYELPLVSWGNALRLHVANMAGYHAMRRRGFNPDSDPLIRKGYDDAIAWLRGPARSDPTIIDKTPDQRPQSVYVLSEPPRGWQRW